jgi:staphylococcal nuclease domain-containing protein 1
MHSRLGADEAKRREALRAAEAEAKAAGNGIWAEGGESVSWSGTSSHR